MVLKYSFGFCGGASCVLSTVELQAQFISSNVPEAEPSPPQLVKTGKTEKSSKTSSITAQDSSFSDNSNEEEDCEEYIEIDKEQEFKSSRRDSTPLSAQKIPSIQCQSKESASDQEKEIEEESPPAIPLQIVLPTSDDIDNYHSNGSTHLEISKCCEQKLHELKSRNVAIMIKRRENIARARRLYQPGTLNFRTRDFVSSKRLPPEGRDDNEISSVASLTSSLMSVSSETGVSACRSQSSSKTPTCDKRSLSASAKDKIFFSDNKSISSTSSHRSTKSLREFSERNMQIGLKRKEEIARARAAARCGSQGKLPLTSSRSESGKTVRSSGSSRSLKSFNSRFDHIYEKGKQKLRSDLNQSQRDKLSSRRTSVAPDKKTSRDLQALKKRDFEISMERREKIAKARAASKSKRELPARVTTFTPRRRRKPISFRE